MQELNIGTVSQTMRLTFHKWHPDGMDHCKLLQMLKRHGSKQFAYQTCYLNHPKKQLSSNFSESSLACYCNKSFSGSSYQACPILPETRANMIAISVVYPLLCNICCFCWRKARLNTTVLTILYTLSEATKWLQIFRIGKDVMICILDYTCKTSRYDFHLFPAACIIHKLPKQTVKLCHKNSYNCMDLSLRYKAEMVQGSGLNFYLASPSWTYAMLLNYAYRTHPSKERIWSHLEQLP